MTGWAAYPIVASIWDLFQRADDGSVTFGWILGRVILALVIANGLLIGAALAVWAERRVAAWIQGRLGPNRVGPEGLLQPLADLGKFIFKEDMLPGHVNRWMYLLAPSITLIPALVTFAVIPYTGSVHTVDGEGAARTVWSSFQMADLNIGILYVLAITSLGVYGITLGGWSSNSKYSLLGGVRSSAQMISYELSLGLAVVAVVLLASTEKESGLHLGRVVSYQAETSWLVFQQPLAFFIFLVASYAETNRLPFDLPEAETELAAGYHTEYSAMKFALFFLAEYIAMIVGAALVTTLFCGGWTLFGLEKAGWVVGLLIFLGKIVFFVFVFIWVRWTLPRFRYDQLMRLGWAWFLPLALGNVVLTATAIAVDRPWVAWLLPVASVLLAVVAVALFVGRRPQPQEVI